MFENVTSSNTCLTLFVDRVRVSWDPRSQRKRKLAYTQLRVVAYCTVNEITWTMLLISMLLRLLLHTHTHTRTASQREREKRKWKGRERTARQSQCVIYKCVCRNGRSGRPLLLLLLHHHHCQYCRCCCCCCCCYYAWWPWPWRCRFYEDTTTCELWAAATSLAAISVNEGQAVSQQRVSEWDTLSSLSPCLSLCLPACLSVSSREESQIRGFVMRERWPAAVDTLERESVQLRYPGAGLMDCGGAN